MNVLFSLSLFLLVFIPLFPKIPLGELLPGYQVRLRLEDILIGLTALVWLRDLFLKKIRWQSLVLGGVLGYAAMGIISIIFAVVILQTVPFELLHLGKSGLHYFRYLEYFSLFFFLYSSLRTKKQRKIILAVISLTLLSVIVYAIGQIYWEWPLYSTMNREYSKGVALTLGEFDRVHSTFGGHYDLAAYLVLILPTLYAFFLYEGNWRRKLFFFFLLGAGSWLMLETKAKTSVIGLALGAGVVSSIWFAQQSKELQRKLLGYGALVVSGVVLSSTLGWFLLSQNYKNKIITRLETNAYGQIVLGYFNTSKDKPADVQQDLPEYRLIATTSATGQVTYTQVVGERQWSDNALKYGLSMGIRLDTLWPQALRGLANNLTLGNGYATLNKKEAAQFTEGDSTDNNYLRVLGELGLVGFLSFFFVVWTVTSQSVKQWNNADYFIKSFSVGFVGATIGLLLNAFYIDVFAASKVAFTYWSLAGVVYAAGYLQDEKIRTKHEETKMKKVYQFFKDHYSLLATSFLLLVLNPANPYAEKSFLLNLETRTTNLNYIFEALGQTPVTSFYSLWLKPWYAILGHQLSFYYANIFSALLTLFFIYLTLKKLKVSIFNQLAIMVSYVILLTLNAIILQPLPFNIWLPLFSIFFYGGSYFLTKKKISFTLPTNILTGGLAISVFIILFTHPFSISNWLNQFRHTILPAKHQTVKRANLYFSATEFLNATNVYFYSTLQPTYVSLFKTATYQPVLLDANLEKNQSDIGQKLGLGRVFLNDYGLESVNNPTLLALNNIFALKMVALDCDDQCNMYELQPNQTILSPLPQTFTDDRLSLPLNFNLTLINQHFNTELDPNFTTLTASAQLAQQNWSNQNFLIVTGELTDKDEAEHHEIFKEYFADTLARPLIYLGSNQHFFNENTYFVLFNPEEERKLSDAERLYVYNRLLELEKLKDIKNVIIVLNKIDSDNLFLTQQLLPRMQAQANKHFNVLLIPASGDTKIDHPYINITTVEISTPTSGRAQVQIQVKNGEVTILP